MNTLFKNASILLPGGEVTTGCLGVQNHLIAFVGDVPEGFQAEKVIDCERNLLMPGSANAHTHLAMTLFRGIADDMDLQTWLETRIWPLEDKLTDEDVYWGTLLAQAEMIRGGCVCSNDMYYFTDAIGRAVADSGARALITRTVMGNGEDGLSRLRESESAFQTWNGAENNRIQVATAVHGEYTTGRSILSAAAESSAKLGTKLHIHVSETFQEHEACKNRHNGMTPLAVLDTLGLIGPNSLLAHCVHVELQDIGTIAARGATVLHCPQSNLKLGSGVAPIPAMLAAKINVALGTDGASSNNNLDMFEEMRLAATLHKGMTLSPTVVTASQALSMATYNGMKAMGWNSGVLAPGCLADLIMVDTYAPHMLPRNNLLNHIVYSAGTGDVLMTMVDGHILYERGEFYTIDMERVAAEINRLQEKYY